MSPEWLEKIRRRLKRWINSGAGTVWVVAVSGGGDSVGLLRVLHGLAPDLGLKLSVAHLNHGVRGDAARRDAEFVRDLALSLGLPVDVGQWAPVRPGHFEADARRARYAWLQNVAAARGASVLAVGHTRDDQAETILHRIIRGTGPRGLAGMPSKRLLSDDPRVFLIRPLLSVSRADLGDYLQELGQTFLDDATNVDLAYTRARLRHDLLPKLARDYNPRVAEALVRLGKLAAANEAALESRLRALETDVLPAAAPDHIELKRDRLVRLPGFLRAEVIRRAWRRAGWPEAGMSADRWRRMAAQARGQTVSRLSVGAGVELSTTGSEDQPPNRFILKRLSAALHPLAERKDFVPLDVPGTVSWHDGTLSALLDPDPDPNCNSNSPRDETIDLDRVVPPLTVRAPAPGDRFQPLGMRGESMPLNDFFRGRGVAREARARTPLLCDAVGIIWVAGHRIAERVKLTEQTRRTLGLRWSPAGSGTE